MADTRDRLSVTITPIMKNQIEEIVEILDTSTEQEAIRRAIKVYHTLLSFPGKIILQSKDSTREVMLL